MKKLIIQILFLISISSCKYYYHTAPKYIKEGFPALYDGKTVRIDSILNIQGYFTADNLLFHNRANAGFMMFFEDGIFVAGSNYNSDYEFKSRELNLLNYFSEIAKNDSIHAKNWFYDNHVWGRYSISGDTIKVQYVMRPNIGCNDIRWYAYEKWYNIIDRNTIIEIFKKPIYKISYSDFANFESYEKKRVINHYIFIPTPVKPKSDGWIKREKWFWKDELKYEEYMKELKESNMKVKKK